MDKLENMNDSLWERIESLMKSQNLTQKEFAAEIGVNPVTITEWKKGKSHSYQKIDTMRRIADALGVSVEELTQENPPIPQKFRYDRMNTLVQETGVSKSHICRKLGKSRYFLRDSEKNNTDIQGECLQIIADALGTTPEYLSGETDEKNPPAPKSESGRNQADELEERFMNAARRLPLPQKIALVEILEAAVGNGSAEIPQIRSRLSASQAVPVGR